MNKRIDKKIHTKYLCDVGCELSQDEKWQQRFSSLDVGEIIQISDADLPESFYKLNPHASKYNLKYKIERVPYQSVPSCESGWWQVNERTVYLAFYPTTYRASRWYAAINF